MTTAIHPAAPSSTVTGQCTCALQAAVLSNDMQQRPTVSSTCLASPYYMYRRYTCTRSSYKDICLLVSGTATGRLLIGLVHVLAITGYAISIVHGIARCVKTLCIICVGPVPPRRRALCARSAMQCPLRSNDCSAPSMRCSSLTSSSMRKRLAIISMRLKWRRSVLCSWS